MHALDPLANKSLHCILLHGDHTVWTTRATSLCGFVPCAAEVTGTLGEQFRSILGKVSQSVDPDGDESPYGPAHSPKVAFDRVVWRHKARIVAWSGS